MSSNFAQQLQMALIRGDRRVSARYGMNSLTNVSREVAEYAITASQNAIVRDSLCSACLSQGDVMVILDADIPMNRPTIAKLEHFKVGWIGSSIVFLLSRR
jgi:hypothetical protein